MIKSEAGEAGDKRVTRFTRLSEWQEARRVKCGLLDTLHAIHLPRLLALPVDNFGILINGWSFAYLKGYPLYF